MQAEDDCKEVGQGSQDVSSKVEIGSIVMATESNEEWSRCRVEGVCEWGALVREIPSGGPPAKGTQFAATWERVELITPAETPGLTVDQHDYHLTIRLGRVVKVPGDYDDIAGKIVGLSPAGCLVEVEGGRIVGADWRHIDLKIDFGAGGIDAVAQAETSPDISVVNGSQPGGASGGVPVVVGDVVWHEDETGSQTREVLAVYPTHAVLDNDDGDPIEAGWDKVLVYAHDAAMNVARRLGQTPDVPAKLAGDAGGDPPHDTDDEALGGKPIGMRFTVKVGDILQGTEGWDGDYIKGRIVSVAQHGVFMESVEEGDSKGEIFGSTWEGLLVHPNPKPGDLIHA